MDVNHNLNPKYHRQPSTLTLTLVLQTAWGSPNNSVAERLMLREALKEPRNQLFVLLSDSGVPLYPPTAVYQHLMGISKSRIDACKPVHLHLASAQYYVNSVPLDLIPTPRWRGVA